MVNIHQQRSCEVCMNECKVFHSLNSDECNTFNSIKRDIAYKKGETIFKQSSFISHIAFIRSGLVKIVSEGFNNKNLIVKFAY